VNNDILTLKLFENSSNLLNVKRIIDQELLNNKHCGSTIHFLLKKPFTLPPRSEAEAAGELI